MTLKILYLLLNFLMLAIILAIGFKAISSNWSDTSSQKKKKTQLIAGLALWQIYIFAIASTGILQDFNLPPKFVILLIVPAFTFTGIFLYKNRKNSWIDTLSLSQLTYLQSFRIAVETLFVFSVAQGVLHQNVTIEGYNYDMLIGLSAPIVAYFFVDKSLNLKILKAWNILGLLVLASVIFVFFTSIFFPAFYGPDYTTFPSSFGTYPYVLIAGFLMPLAVFIHFLSIIVINKKSAENA